MHIGSILVTPAQYMIARLYMRAVEDQDRAETGLLISVSALNLMCCMQRCSSKNSSRCDPNGSLHEKVEGATAQF